MSSQVKKSDRFSVGKSSLPQNSVLITFDDGYENNFTQAFPILQRHRVSAAFFLTTGLVGQFTVDSLV